MFITGKDYSPVTLIDLVQGKKPKYPDTTAIHQGDQINRSRTYTWTEEMVLRRHYVIKGAEWCAKRLNRTVNSVRKKAENLSLFRVTQRKHWTPDEDRLLLDCVDRDWMYVDISNYLKSRGFNRSPDACFYRYKYMNEKDLLRHRPILKLINCMGLENYRLMRGSSDGRTTAS